MLTKKYFCITEDHIKLLKRMYVSWYDCEYGAPCIDPNRLYGNSYVIEDIAEILGIKSTNKDDPSEFTEKQEQEMRKIHEEMEYVLQIFIKNGKIETGEYSAEEYSTDWRKI